ncbi:MAG: NADH-quinone oxidoreductase subunit NuoG [Candidatus Anammoxibacter sp.]
MTINLTIDEKKISVPEGTSIMEAARKNGIDIPGFCYHPKLDSFGACRVCMVHVTERGRTRDKFACAQPVSEGMEVQTKSEKITKYTKSVTEYLLAHHPLDCPVCDKSGECELQDVTFKLGLSKGRIKTERRNEPSVKDNPILEFNHNRCILCGRCTRVCGEVQGIAAIDFQGRGFNTKIGTNLGKPLNCEFCGQCLSVCPVGAIQDRVFNFNGRPWEFKTVKTTCTYCSVGCTLSLNTRNGSVVRITSDDDVGINNGNLCSKGRFGFQFIHSNDRVLEPLVKKNGKLVPTSWEKALKIVAEKFTKIKQQHGADSIGGLGSEKCTNEENYLFQKLFRVAIGSKNIDNIANIRAPYLNEMILDATSNEICLNTFEDIKDADMVLLFGIDIAEELPVAGNMLRKVIKDNGTSLVIVNTRNVDFKSTATDICNVRYEPGTEQALINGLIKLMIEEHLLDTDNIEQNVDNFSELKEHLDDSTLKSFLKIAGVDNEQLLGIAKSFNNSGKRYIFVGKELLKNTVGKNSLKSLINLAYITKYGCGSNTGGHGTTNIIFPREHNNSQGVNDMGVVPGFLPGYQNIAETSIRDRFSKRWSESPDKSIDISIPESSHEDEDNIFELAIKGKIKALYIMGDNPVQTHVDGSEARQAINSLDFTVVQDSFLTETAYMADVVLPSVTFAEKEGSFSNMGMLAQKVNKAIEPLGDAKADWQIISALAEKLGYTFNYAHPGEIMEEISELVPMYSKVNYQDLKTNGIKLINNTNVKSSPQFNIVNNTKKVKHENTEKQYPFVLTTGNIMFHLGTYSNRSKALNEIYPFCKIEINPDDAKEINLNENDSVEICAPNGELRLKVKITKKSPRGVVFIPSNIEDVPVNLLIDKNSDQRVRITKVVLAY